MLLRWGEGGTLTSHDALGLVRGILLEDLLGVSTGSGASCVLLPEPGSREELM